MPANRFEAARAPIVRPLLPLKTPGPADSDR